MWVTGVTPRGTFLRGTQRGCEEQQGRGRLVVIFLWVMPSTVWKLSVGWCVGMHRIVD
jgi:hypothetical protein